MIKKSSSQAGSAHAVIIIVIIAALLGALGFVFWKNFVTKDTSPQPSSKAEKNQPKRSEVITLEGDMNKYVNYEEGFEFLFPKNILADINCKANDMVYLPSGESKPTIHHFISEQGPAPLTVLEAEGRYIIMPKETVVRSDIVREGDYHLARACDKQPSTIALANFQNSLESNEYVSNAQKREFEIVKVESMDDITNFVRNVSGDTQATAILGKLTGERQSVTFKFGPDIKTGGFAYKMWYYPAKKKIVSIVLGQGAVFIDPVDTKKYYDMQVADSFSFTK